MDTDKQAKDPFETRIVPDAAKEELNDDQLDDVAGGMKAASCGGGCTVPKGGWK